jgi:hypothetical protein
MELDPAAFLSSAGRFWSGLRRMVAEAIARASVGWMEFRSGRKSGDHSLAFPLPISVLSCRLSWIRDVEF